jgi:hypothetical protein
MQDNQSQTHWAYIAGIMDADGCFMISRHHRKTLKRVARLLNVERWSATYMANVKVCMIEPEAVRFIQNVSGIGKITLDGARSSRPNSKPIYHWLERDKAKIIPFLEQVIPFLKVKKNRAQHLLDYCKTVKDCGKPYYGLSKEELNYREESYQKMREFNGNKVGATTKPLGRESVSDSLTL